VISFSFHVVILCTFFGVYSPTKVAQEQAVDEEAAQSTLDEYRAKRVLF